MTTIKAIVRNGRLEVEQPISLPDGTVLQIPVPSQTPAIRTRDDDAPDTPAEIESWICWFDALEPIELTDQERAELEAARRDERSIELAKWDQHLKQVEGLFP